MIDLPQPLEARAPGSGRASGSSKAPKSGPCREKEVFSLLPDDLLASMIACLDVKALLCLQQCDKRLARLAGSEKLWRGVFMARFGLPSNNQETAHKLAGSWQALYKSKVVSEQAAGQWRKPCPYELQAALQTMIHTNTSTTSTASTSTPTHPHASSRLTSGSQDNQQVDASPAAAAASEDAAGGPAGSQVSDSPIRRGSSASSSGGSPTLSSSNSIDSGVMNNEGMVEGAGVGGKTQLAVIFLLDSSGSVADEDFSCMTDFLETAAQAMARVDNCKVCVVQFSNDTRVEVPLGPLDKPVFDAAIGAMVRLNGGTNIASAVAKAGALLKADEATHSPDMRRVLVLLTDGRIDSYQAREAASMVSRLSDEQANVALWAFGVGRGVDSAELMRVIEGPGEAAKGLGRERYMDLCVRDDAPW